MRGKAADSPEICLCLMRAHKDTHAHTHRDINAHTHIKKRKAKSLKFTVQQKFREGKRDTKSNINKDNNKGENEGYYVY